MSKGGLIPGVFTMIILAACCMLFAATASAHCDTTTGPVVTEARSALEKGDVTPTLKWVKKEDEAQIRAMFAKALAVRKNGGESKELADQYFLETLVRLHRAAEGAPYAGIKDEPADPIIVMADEALAGGSADEMIRLISEHMATVIEEKFHEALQAKKTKDESVEAGRRFVKAYVTYTHYVEGVHAAIAADVAHHTEGEGAAGHTH